ncbi:hypothetical protein [Yinghuangia sp. YIM S10712]
MLARGVRGGGPLRPSVVASEDFEDKEEVIAVTLRARVEAVLATSSGTPN